ncbi:hypothetical protein C5167_007316 [Papaver somniferum]|nr:hypothetical protein C5167_007316 [Papaver somniferum]
MGADPRAIEAECGSRVTKTILTKILSHTSPSPLMVPKDKGSVSEHPVTLPLWLTEEDKLEICTLDKGTGEGTSQVYGR